MSEAMYWLIALAILLIIEIATLGLTTIWFAGGALAAFFFAMAHVNIFVQFVVFIVVSLLLLFFTRPVAVKYFNGHRVKTNYEGLIGKEARVIERIDNFNQTGRVIINGQEWMARSKNDLKNIEIEARVFVCDIKGVKAIVSEKKEDI